MAQAAAPFTDSVLNGAYTFLLTGSQPDPNAAQVVILGVATFDGADGAKVHYTTVLSSGSGGASLAASLPSTWVCACSVSQVGAHLSYEIVGQPAVMACSFRSWRKPCE